MIRLVEAMSKDRELLWNIHQKYLHEMTNYYDNEMDEQGNYHYGYFDAYFSEPERKALLIYFSGRLAGFAMVNPHSYIGGDTDYVLAEFTIFPAFRRQGLAFEAARRILEMYSGCWEIKYNEKNAGAKHLWNRLAAPYNPKRHRCSDVETVLEFSTV